MAFITSKIHGLEIHIFLDERISSISKEKKIGWQVASFSKLDVRKKLLIIIIIS